MQKFTDLSDDEIDALLLLLFNGGVAAPAPEANCKPTKHIHELTDDDLRRVRSRNHPDKWPNVNLEAYQAAITELDRRRNQR